jgi:hypothetical protein
MCVRSMMSLASGFGLEPSNLFLMRWITSNLFLMKALSIVDASEAKR